MDPGDSQRPALQGTDRPHHRPRQYHRDRHRVLPLSPYHGEAQGQNHGYEDLIPRRRAAGESNDLCNGSLKLWRAIKERRGWAKSEYQSGPSCIVKITPSASEIDDKASAALSRLYSQNAGARAL